MRKYPKSMLQKIKPTHEKNINKTNKGQIYI